MRWRRSVCANGRHAAQHRKRALATPLYPFDFESREASWRKKVAPLAGIYAAARASPAA
jgi:hypothetical protein